MTCGRRTGEWVSLDLDGRLSARDAVRLEAHLAVCPECATLADDLRRTHAAAKRLGRVAAPPELIFGIERRTREIPMSGLGAGRWPIMSRRAGWLAMVSATCALVGAGRVWDLRERRAREASDVAVSMATAGAQVVALSAASPLDDVAVLNLEMLSDVEARIEEQSRD